MIRYNVGLRLTVNGGGVAAATAKAGAGARQSGNQAKQASSGWGFLARGFRTAQQMAGGAIRGVGQLAQRTRGLYASTIQGVRGVGSFASSLFSLRNVVGGFIAYLGGKSLFDWLIGSNADLEQSRISIAQMVQTSLTLKNRQGELLTGQKAWNASLRISDALIKRFRKIALDDPIVSTNDMLTMFQALQSSADRTGASYKELINFSQKAVAIAKLLRAPGISAQESMQNVARDITQLLGGSTSIAELSKPMQQVMSSIIRTIGGFERWNKLKPAEQFKLIYAQANKKISPEAVKAYQKSWYGLIDTFGEWKNLLGQIAGERAFEVIRGWLQSSTQWLSDNQERVQSLAKSWGENFANGLENAYRFAVKLISYFRDNEGAIKSTLVETIKDMGYILESAANFIRQIRELGIARKSALGWLTGERMTDEDRKFLLEQANRRNPVVKPSKPIVPKLSVYPTIPSKPIVPTIPSKPIVPIVPKLSVFPTIPTPSTAFARPAINVNVQQTISTQDPVQAGTQAAKGVGRAVKIAINNKSGTPITNQQR